MDMVKKAAPYAAIPVLLLLAVFVGGAVGGALGIAAVFIVYLLTSRSLQARSQAIAASGASQIIIQRVRAIVAYISPIPAIGVGIILLALGLLTEGTSLAGGFSSHALSLAALFALLPLSLLTWRGWRMSQRGVGGPVESDEIFTFLQHKPEDWQALPEEEPAVQTGPSPEELVASHAEPPVEAAPAQALEEVLFELDSMLGLQKVKGMIRSEIAYVQAEQMKQAQNPSYTPAPLRRHAIYAGPPGTGKTTVAKLHSAALHSLGIVNGLYHQTTASELISPHIGRSGQQTREMLHSFLGGMVFVDEVQGFLERAGEGANLGREALQTFLNEMENNPDCPLIVFASYPEIIEAVLQQDPGLRSRFRVRVDFESYGPQELTQIALKQARDEQHRFSPAAQEALLQTFTALHGRFSEYPSWSSARVAVTLYGQIKRAQSENLTGEDPFELRVEDVRRGLEEFLNTNPFGAAPPSS